MSSHGLFCVCKVVKEKKLAGIFLSYSKDTSPTGLRTTVMTSFNLDYLLQGSFSEYYHIGVWGFNIWI